MTNQSIQVEYREGLDELEKVLSDVRRSGDFFVQGRIEVPMPKLEVDGIGVISFPVPVAQVRQLIEQAERAPYGRGEETILDESVRKVWQLPPDKVRIGGKSWAGSFRIVLDQVAAGLGCEKVTVSAELYKLLVYDPGAFFAAHRDTEKADGMFGTLVVMLPSAHRGGELIIRHAGREVMVDLSAAEMSELAFAAFYADCEHEVRPIAEGNRVCLIYNLVQRREPKGRFSLTAPLYDAEAPAASECITKAFNGPDAPAKIVWLLEHQYSPDGLSFSGLKNADAARAKVLSQAAAQAGCVAHLGVVHIEEYGPAQPNYDGGYGYGRRSRWRSYDEEEVEEDASSDDFEVIEVSDGQQYIDQWVDAQERRVGFGRIPLGKGELLPNGALDDEKPDEQRLTEATGNEGASFERSFHRAALVVWPQERFADVLLQAGVGAVMPYLKERVENATSACAKPALREEVAALARRVLDVWENTPEHQLGGRSGKEPSRAEMLDTLGRLGGAELIARFVSGIVIRNYDGTESAALAVHARLLKPAQAGELFSELARANMPSLHGACVNLLTRFLREHDGKPRADWAAALQKVAAAMVEGLVKVQSVSKQNLDYSDWQRAEKAKPVNAALVADLLDVLGVLEAEALREKAAKGIIAQTAVFEPGRVLVPALTLLHERHGQSIESDAAFVQLWQHAVEFLLARAEHPPDAPKDWRQEVKLSCQCEDCRALQKFTRDAEAQVGRFRVRQDRRQHLHQMIERHGLDMTHVTERKGSPQTLVCTKTRRTYQRQCEQYEADIRSFGELTKTLPRASSVRANLASRIAEARTRAENWTPRP